MNTVTKALVVFSIMVIGLLGLNFGLSRMTPYQAIEEDESLIDEYMVGVRAKQFDDEGILRQTLTIQSVIHKQGEPTMALTLPALEYIRKDGSIWSIASKQGTSYHREDKAFEKIELFNQVLIHVEPTQKPGWTASTHFLSYDPKTALAITHDEVLMSSGPYTMRGVGMQTDVNAGTIELLEQVESEYAIQNLS